MKLPDGFLPGNSVPVGQMGNLLHAGDNFGS